MESEPVRPHLAASASTTEEARRGRSETEIWLLAHPEEARQRWMDALARSDSADPRVRRGIQNAYAAYVRRDWEVNTLLFDESFNYSLPDASARPPDFPPSADGVGEYIAAAERFLDAWTEFSLEVRQVVDVRPDRVVSLFRMTGRGAGAGVFFDIALLDISEVRDGLLIRQTLRDPEAGLRELGLVPPAAGR